MLEYIKIIIVSFITSLFMPTAISSTLGFSLLNAAVNFSADANALGFYFGVNSVVFALVSIFYVRKIYAKGFNALLNSGNGKKGAKNAKSYKSMMTGLLISLVLAIVMFIPVSKETFLLDVLSNNLIKDNLLVGASCSIASGIILLVALWYARVKNEKKHRSSTLSDVVRMTVYQIPAHIFPGFSNVSMAASSLTVSGLDDKVIMRECFIYLAPSMLVVGVERIISAVVSGLVIDIAALVLCVIGAALGNIIMFNFVSKVNIRKSYLFFSIVSIIFGLIAAFAEFVIR